MGMSSSESRHVHKYPLTYYYFVKFLGVTSRLFTLGPSHIKSSQVGITLNDNLEAWKVSFLFFGVFAVVVEW